MNPPYDAVKEIRRIPMAIFDIILFAIVFAFLGFALVTRIKKITLKYGFFLYLVPTVLSLIHLLVCGMNLFLIPLMLGAVFVILLYPARKRWWTFIPVFLLSGILAAASIVLPAMENMQNYASFSYTESFARLNAYFADTYPLADYKEVNYDEKYAEFLPLFQEAEKTGDKKAYFDALSAYIASFHDSHIAAAPAEAFLGMNLTLGEFVSWRNEDFGGDLGFSVIRADDGRALAIAVDENGTAYTAGLRNGTEITMIDGKSPDEAASTISLFFAPQGGADSSNRLLMQYMMLGRCPVGKEVSVSFLADDGSTSEISVTAQEKTFDTLNETFDTVLRAEPATAGELYSFSMLDDSTAYMRIATMMYDDEPAVLAQIESDLASLVKNKGENLIIDLRRNGGGEDTFGAKLKGLFTDQEDFYLSESELDSKTGELAVENTIRVTPNASGFTGRIIILVNTGSASAAEGFAYNMAELPNVSVAGMMGTNGSFGTITDGFVLMSDNFLVIFPRIACVEEDGRVMIDTDASGNGGVEPDIKIPVNEDAVHALFDGKKDYELDYVLSWLAGTVE